MKKKDKSRRQSKSKEEAMDSDQDRFLKSLRELRDLRSQIYHAADCCKTAFLETEDKKLVMDNTKEYICRAVVTIVDHLGSVSCKLDSRFRSSDNASNTELRITVLEQKLRSHENCKQYLSFPKVCWSLELPRCYPHYISPGEKPIKELRDSIVLSSENGISKDGMESAEVVPTLTLRSAGEISVPKSPTLPLYFDTEMGVAPLTSVMPAHDGFRVSSKLSSPAFHFQLSKVHLKHKRRPSSWKSIYDKDILSRILWRKDTSKLLKYQV